MKNLEFNTELLSLEMRLVSKHIHSQGELLQKIHFGCEL
jgi:hypothetical protein